MLEYNKSTASDQHIMMNNAIFVTAQNVTQNITQNTEKNAVKIDANNSRILIDLFDMLITSNKSSESNL